MHKLLIGGLALALAGVSLVLGAPAHGQTVLSPPSIKWGSSYIIPTAVQIVSYDSMSGLPCIVGSTATCVLTSGGGGGSASVGLNGAAAPTSSTQIAWQDNGGLLQPITLTNPLPMCWAFGGSCVNPATPVPSYFTPIVPITSPSAEACRVFKNSPGTLYGASGAAGGAGWIMFFNSTTIPSDGAIANYIAPIQISQAGPWSLGVLYPMTFSTGITECFSSTGPATKTAVSTNNFMTALVQ
jgi:hypothetical protein